MKEATGEMTTTIIVIIGLVAVLALGTTFVWPKIKNQVLNKTNTIIDNNYSYVEDYNNYNI